MDTALSLLQQALPDGGQCILCLDENTLGNALNLPEQCRVYSNRWDIAKTIKAAQFSDWQLAEQGVDCFAFRVSKEKAVNHYLINRAFALLAPGGSLIFAGEKNQGTKTYAKKAGQLLGQAEIEKHGMDYLVKVTKTCADSDKLLDDQDYHTLRSIAALGELELFSKPGQFGWNKLDKGSLFLLELITEKLDSSVSSLLDLGCGYGLLACQLGLQLKLETIIATDNNAAALASCEHNLQQLNALHPKLNTQVIAA
ncbi:MAG: methyltransferase, partial [Cellvibrionaceae bacterium]|nr:methyltransferase [Cellvibrionaceae bacterium]